MRAAQHIKSQHHCGITVENSLVSDLTTASSALHVKMNLSLASWNISSLALLLVDSFSSSPGPPHSNQIVAPTIAPTSQKPEYSRSCCLTAPLVVEDVLESSVPFVSVPFVPLGRVPLMTSVLVLLTFPIWISVLFSSAALPFPTSESK